MISKQGKKADKLLSLHHAHKLLILPNIWDVLGAKLLEAEGFEAVATASASVAFSRGFDDNQELDFEDLLKIVKSICESTDLPVTADIEKGYAFSTHELSNNTKKLLEAGVVGINIEDSEFNADTLVDVQEQYEKIKLIRATASKVGVPIVINARTDIFLVKNFTGDRLEEAIKRGQHYKEAGADCFYPILCSNEELEIINERVDLPLNVLARADTPSIKKLESLGIARMSLGPSLLKSALTKMKEVLNDLKNGTNYDSFTNSEILTSSEIIKIIKK